jgi:Trk K+ transport system NAD-binding subunit
MKRRFDQIRVFPLPALDVLERVTSRRNARLLTRLFLTLAGLVVFDTIAFHVLMGLEGQSHSWITGVYWTFTTMTTLGLGDIVFFSDIGKAFTTFVLVTGVFFPLVIVPFTIFQPFQSAARVPRELPRATSDHVVLVQYGPIAAAVIEKLKHFGHPYVLITPELTQASYLRDHGIRAVLGACEDPETFRQVRVESAALVVATGSNVTNTSSAYAVRQVSTSVPIVATATDPTAEKVLTLAGCATVVTLDELMGQSLARRTVAGDAIAHVIGQIDDLVIAEATATGTPLVDKKLEETDVRNLTGVTVVGVWEHGQFRTAAPDMRIHRQTVLVLAGSHQQIEMYNELFCIYNVSSAPVVILGGGNVGRAMARSLSERELDYRIVERAPHPAIDPKNLISGDAVNHGVLLAAGIMEAPAVAITTHDDDTNIYLTTYCRHLRPDIQIISRATLERNVQILHRAGCDFVMSYASMGANMIVNLLRHGDIVMLAEGVDVFKVELPPSFSGKRLSETSIREECGCSVIAVSQDHRMRINPDPGTLLEAGSEIVLLGTVDSENTFLDRYGQSSTD